MLFSPLLSFYFHLFHFHPLFPFWKSVGGGSSFKKKLGKENYILHDILLVALYFLLNVADVHFKGSPEKKTLFLYFELDTWYSWQISKLSNVYRFINSSLTKWIENALKNSLFLVLHEVLVVFFLNYKKKSINFVVVKGAFTPLIMVRPLIKNFFICVFPKEEVDLSILDYHIPYIKLN